MKKRYAAALMTAALVTATLFTACSGTTEDGTDTSTNESADTSSQEVKEDKKEASKDEKAQTDEKEESAPEATEEAVVEDGWKSDKLYDLSYATPEEYELIIDDVSDHSESGSFYEKAYSIGPEGGDTIGIHMYAYEKNTGVSDEAGYTTVEKLVKNHESLEGVAYEEITIPSLAAKVWCTKVTDDDSYLPYSYTYIFEKSTDDKYIYEIQFNDRLDSSALHESFKKSLTF